MKTINSVATWPRRICRPRAQHDDASLHRRRYRVGAPLALRSRMRRRCVLFVREGRLRVADRLLEVCAHVHAVCYTRFRCQERRGELGSRLQDWSFEVLTDRAHEGIR